MERKHLEALLLMVRAVSKGDLRKGGGEGREALAELEAAIGAELNPPAACVAPKRKCGGCGRPDPGDVDEFLSPYTGRCRACEDVVIAAQPKGVTQS